MLAHSGSPWFRVHALAGSVPPVEPHLRDCLQQEPGCPEANCSPDSTFLFSGSSMTLGNPWTVMPCVAQLGALRTAGEG